MKFFKFLICIFIIIVLTPVIVIADDFDEPVNLDMSAINVSADATNEPQISSRRAIVLERNSNAVLYEKNSLEVCKMASTTKIMTCILILENCNLDSQVTVSAYAASTYGSRLGLHTNDVLSVQDLLYGLMLCSGNDAAVCLAEFCGGSVDGFANMMNLKAAELSLENTHFVTPHGLDNENHYTTARDFAILTDYALDNPLFVQIVGTKYYTVSINGSAKDIHNTNALLGNIPSVYGVKTGYTSQAGRCLISSAKQDNLDIIVVIFGSDTSNIRNSDSIALINYVFSNFEAVDFSTIVNNKLLHYKEYVLPYVSILKGDSKLLVPELDAISLNFYPVKKNLVDSLSVTLEEFDLEAPIAEKQPVAKITILVDNHQVFSTNIVSSAYISKKSSFDYLNYFILNYKNFYQIY